MDFKSVPAPAGFHWMKQKNGKYKLMKDPKDGYMKHPGSSKRAKFGIQKTHRKKKK
tara:strand:+ start:68 stop:235 length:168 start_codon:yes stop_codon:yes gene_type:complete